MELTRRKILGLILTVPILGFSSGLRLFERVSGRQARAAHPSRYYPGHVVPFDFKRLRRKAKWNG